MSNMVHFIICFFLSSYIKITKILQTSNIQRHFRIIFSRRFYATSSNFGISIRIQVINVENKSRFFPYSSIAVIVIRMMLLCVCGFYLKKKSKILQDFYFVPFATTFEKCIFNTLFAFLKNITQLYFIDYEVVNYGEFVRIRLR